MDQWARFLRTFLFAFAGLALVCAGLIVWANPYRNIPFVTKDRPLKDVNQRHLYPAVARDLRFDSAVFGTSSIRLLKPAELEAEMPGTFAQLSMNSATAYEQYRLARLFVEQRQKAGRPIGTVIVGVDVVWCGTGAAYEKFTFRDFPPWMYDDDPWNDLLYLFNGKALEISGRILGHYLGLDRKETYGQDGYGNFLPPPREYDLKKARRNVYGTPEPKPVVPQVPPVEVGAAERAGWAFGTHALMRELLDMLPADTRVLLVFAPYHVYKQPRPGSREAAVYDECKARFTRMAGARPNTAVFDFMRPSPITREDTNYWDPLHYTVETASLLAKLIGQGVRGERDDAYFTVLHDGLKQRVAGR